MSATVLVTWHPDAPARSSLPALRTVAAHVPAVSASARRGVDPNDTTS